MPHDLEQPLYVHSNALTYFDWTGIRIYARGMNYIANRDRNKPPDVIHTVYLGGALTSQLPRLTIAQIFWNGCLLCAFRSIVLPSAIVYLLFGL